MLTLPVGQPLILEEMQGNDLTEKECANAEAPVKHETVGTCWNQKDLMM